MAKLKTLAVANNVSEAHQMTGEKCSIKVTTSESSTITVEHSVDGEDWTAVTDFSETLDGTANYPFRDFIDGQFVRVKATAGVMTACKILAE